MWNITDEGIEYSVYRPNGDSAEELKHGYFVFGD